MLQMIFILSFVLFLNNPNYVFINCTLKEESNYCFRIHNINKWSDKNN